jgi:ABC-type sugar transport system permease subunit
VEIAAPRAFSSSLSWARQRLGPNIFFGAVILVMLWLVLVPMGQLVLNSFRVGHPAVPSPFTLKNYTVGFANPLTYQMIWNTVFFAGAGTFITVFIAVLFAWLTERTNMPGRNLAWSLLLVPLAMPGFLFSMAWIFLLDSRVGVINMWLRALFSLFGWDFETGPINIYSMGGMIYLDGLRGVTTVFLLVVGAFRAMDPNLEEAARISGAKGWTTFRRVTLPTLLPAIFAAFCLQHHDLLLDPAHAELWPSRRLRGQLLRHSPFSGGHLPKSRFAASGAVCDDHRQRLQTARHPAGASALAGIGPFHRLLLSGGGPAPFHSDLGGVVSHLQSADLGRLEPSDPVALPPAVGRARSVASNVEHGCDYLRHSDVDRFALLFRFVDRCSD